MAPAGPVDEATVQRAVDRCVALGLEPRTGDAIRSRHRYLAGTDAERARDLTRAIDGDTAIWALRGGYGTLRTLEHVDLSPLRDRPRPFIGFSDNTAVHLALLREGLVSFHGPHAGGEYFPATTAAVFRAVVMTPEPAGTLERSDEPRPAPVVDGVAEGPLVGGNLSLLAAACGTRYQPDTRGAILFIEEVAEPPYRVDRMLMQLKLAGLLDDVAGVALGTFGKPEEDPGPGSDAAAEADPGVDPNAHVGADPEAPLRPVFQEILASLGVPVALGLPFGHGRENWTLPLGIPARLDADAGTLALLEAAVVGRKD